MTGSTRSRGGKRKKKERRGCRKRVEGETGSRVSRRRVEDVERELRE